MAKSRFPIRPLHRMAGSLPLLALVLTASCARSAARDGADAPGVRTLSLERIRSLPPMTIEVPELVEEVTLEGVDPPVVYTLTGGSLSECLVAQVLVGRDPHDGTAPASASLPTCTGTERTSRRGELEAVTCDRANGRTTTVAHAHAGGRIVCMASWDTAGEPDERQLAVARAIEASCATLRFR